MSARRSTCPLSVKASGAMYPVLPFTTPARVWVPESSAFATPKSTSFTRPS